MCDICIKPIHFYLNVNLFGYCSTLTIQSLVVSFMIKHFYKKIYIMYFFPIERPPTAHLQHLGGPLEGLGPQVGKLLYTLTLDSTISNFIRTAQLFYILSQMY